MPLSEGMGVVSRRLHRSAERHPELRRVRPRLRERRGVRRRSLRVCDGLAELRQPVCRSDEQSSSLRGLQHSLRGRPTLRVESLHVPTRPDRVR
jgi:hypothetical protein